MEKCPKPIRNHSEPEWFQMVFAKWNFILGGGGGGCPNLFLLLRNGFLSRVGGRTALEFGGCGSVRLRIFMGFAFPRVGVRLRGVVDFF